MPLVTGEKIGTYEILELIGAGGMGEVYRARDIKLRRDVALKVLPETFARDPGRMARFQREAEVLASLNHPNIAHIYGVEERTLVMELVEGESPKGPLPFEDAWKIALQIADALEYAHERGVIHRDLKPANVKVTPDGVVKLLDFGLAKAFSETPDAGSADPENSPTITLGATVAGTVMGTAAYMAPEQAKGKRVDKRADIWSWGVVLYELLTGERLFKGDEAADTLAQVLTKEPDWNRAPVQVQRLLQRCLEKDPKKRLRDIGDARLLLKDAQEMTASPPVQVWRRPVVPWSLLGAVVLIAAALGAGLWRATQPPNRPLVRLDVDLGPEVALPFTTNNVSLSPDGTRLVFVSGNQRRLYTRRQDQSKATELPGTDGASFPFFSPDGQWVGFFKGNNKLSKISVEGGAAVPLADVGRGYGGSWGADGNLILGGGPKGLLQISASGGTATNILEVAPGESLYSSPQILPGGKAVLFTNGIGSTTSSIEVFSFADRQRKTVVRGGANPHYLPSGHLIYTNQATLFAIPFDLNRLETHGTAVPVLNDIAYSPAGMVSLSVAQNGALVYRRGGGESATQIQWVDSTGKKEPLLAKPGVYSNPRISPDGKRMALIADGDVWVYDLQRDAMNRLTFGGDNFGSWPVWSPDGGYVVFSVPGKGIYWTRADGAGQPQPLTQSKNEQVSTSFTPDGKRLAYHGFAGKWQIWTVPLETQDGQLKAGKPEQFLKSQFDDVTPVFSPDGHWLAYKSGGESRCEACEVYVRAFPPPASGQAGQWQISNGGRTYTPKWSRNGHELIYLQGDQLMAVSYSVNGDSFVPEKPRVWIDKVGGTNWDLAADGKRVAVVTPMQTAEAPKPDHEVVLLQNFFDELRRRVRVGDK